MGCPRCGDYNVSMPTLVLDALGVERLEYYCRKCGHAWRTPTIEQERKAVADAMTWRR